MSKSLRSMIKEGRAKAIERRFKSQTKRNGYWAAVDAKKKIEEKSHAVLHNQNWGWFNPPRGI